MCMFVNLYLKITRKIFIFELYIWLIIYLYIGMQNIALIVYLHTFARIRINKVYYNNASFKRIKIQIIINNYYYLII